LSDLSAQGELLMSTVVFDKKADLAGPGIGDYAELERILLDDYHPLLTPGKHSEPSFTSRATSKATCAKN
jgi:hypothetical protein